MPRGHARVAGRRPNPRRALHSRGRNRNRYGGVSMTAPLIEVKNLQRHFGASNKPVRAVDDVSFSIQPGETLGLVGESGSGKSTIGRTLLRLIEATSGQVLYRGEDLGTASSSRMRALRSKLQMIFQDPYASLNPKMRVKD